MQLSWVYGWGGNPHPPTQPHSCLLPSLGSLVRDPGAPQCSTVSPAGWSCPCPVQGSPIPGSTLKHRGVGDPQRTHPPTQHPHCSISHTRHPQPGAFTRLFTPSSPPYVHKMSLHIPRKETGPATGKGAAEGRMELGSPWGTAAGSRGDGTAVCQHLSSCRPGTRDAGGCSSAPRRAQSHESPGASSVPSAEGHGRGERHRGGRQSCIYATPGGK